MLETMKAAIFDMDGTLIDSMTRWREMNGAFVRQMGIIPDGKAGSGYDVHVRHDGRGLLQKRVRP